MRVLVCPDSYKGTASSVEACGAMREGWLSVRPDDDVAVLPFADGGEGTLDALEAAVRGSRRHRVAGVTGPDGAPTDADWLSLPDGTAVVEMAEASGLPKMARLDALGATSRGTGEVIRAALDRGPRRIALGLGGSASSDGGAGILRALGLAVLDEHGHDVPDGAAGLTRAARVDRTDLVAPPPEGVVLVTDVDNPLLGPHGAAAVFGPQKGASPQDVQVIERALSRWCDLVGADPRAPGGGAAGGTAAGVSAVWGARVEGGSAWLAELLDVDRRVAEADLVLTGEGCFDATSLGGKAVGRLLDVCRRSHTHAAVVAGTVRHDPPGRTRVVALDELAGSAEQACQQAQQWLAAAAAELARAY